MVLVLYSGIIQLQVQSDLELTSLLAIITPALVIFIKNSRSNTEFLHEIIIIFSTFYVSENTFVISLFNLRIEF